MKQYIDFARSKGATPVLITPIANKIGNWANARRAEKQNDRRHKRGCGMAYTNGGKSSLHNPRGFGKRQAYKNPHGA